MDDNKLAKLQQQFEKTKSKIKKEKNNIEKKIGHQLIINLNLDYAQLDTKRINKLINKIAYLYHQKSETHE